MCSHHHPPKSNTFLDAELVSQDQDTKDGLAKRFKFEQHGRQRLERTGHLHNMTYIPAHISHFVSCPEHHKYQHPDTLHLNQQQQPKEHQGQTEPEIQQMQQHLDRKSLPSTLQRATPDGGISHSKEMRCCSTGPVDPLFPPPPPPPSQAMSTSPQRKKTESDWNPYTATIERSTACRHHQVPTLMDHRRMQLNKNQLVSSSVEAAAAKTSRASAVGRASAATTPDIEMTPSSASPTKLGLGGFRLHPQRGNISATGNNSNPGNNASSLCNRSTMNTSSSINNGNDSSSIFCTLNSLAAFKTASAYESRSDPTSVSGDNNNAPATRAFSGGAGDNNQTQTTNMNGVAFIANS